MSSQFKRRTVCRKLDESHQETKGAKGRGGEDNTIMVRERGWREGMEGGVERPSRNNTRGFDANTGRRI